MSETATNILTDSMDKSADFWLLTLAVVVVLIILCAIARKVAKTLQIILVACLLFVSVMLMRAWVRDRNEPRVITPVVDFVASFFPKPSATPPTPERPPKTIN